MAPAGGENPTGFHPCEALRGLVPGCPCGLPLRGAKTLRVFIVSLPGGENPSGFHPFLNPVPNRGISGWQAEYRHAAAVLTRWVRNAAA
jgi:hypothetical protein